MEGIDIKQTSDLNAELDGSIVILIAGQYYTEIAKQLCDMGFKVNKDFFNGFTLINYILTYANEFENFWEEYYLLQNYQEQLDMQIDDLIERSCHFNELFVNLKGDVFPCCRTWMRKEMKIGNVYDNDLTEKIKLFNCKCNCGLYRFRKSKLEDKFNYKLLNLELSLACNGVRNVLCRRT